MEAHRVAILYHNYYSLDGVEELRARIAALHRRDVLFLCSLPEKFLGQTPPQRADEHFMLTANVGKDIGGKLLLIELLLSLYPDIPFAVLLHDKRSYHKHSGQWERDGLFRVLGADLFPVIEAAFERDAKMGIACAKGYVRNEYLGDGRFDTSNSELLGELMTKYRIPHGDLRFVAGTMFWIRTSILRAFFGQGGALDVRATLEAGNVLDHAHGTVTHSWERMLSWIATAAGYRIKEF
jgi:hypothetical protein